MSVWAKAVRRTQRHKIAALIRWARKHQTRLMRGGLSAEEAHAAAAEIADLLDQQAAERRHYANRAPSDLLGAP